MTKLPRRLAAFVAFICVILVDSATGKRPEAPPEAKPYPIWSQQLDSTDGEPTTGCDSTRFKCIWDGTVVLDMETGLIWERNLRTRHETYYSAFETCQDLYLGGRHGWRLPSDVELRTLTAEPDSLTDGVAVLLVEGAPVNNLRSPYWTSTPHPIYSDRVVVRHFIVGSLPSAISYMYTQGDATRVWCVRGQPLQ